MSVTPLRPSSAAQSTRRVSFSPAVDEVLDTVEKRRDRAAPQPPPSSRYSVETDNELRSEKNPSEPSTTSHRTRLAPTYSPARRRTSVSTPPPPSEEVKHPDHDRLRATTSTTTIEFSLKDIPLDGKMAPPVWREPSPGRSTTSRRVSPARGGTPISARLSSARSRGGDNDEAAASVTGNGGDGDEPLPAARLSANPYTDVARDSANMLRRQRVVRTFFESHEDAVRLYIRLQQLLSYRDLCHAEFQQRLGFMNSDEERQAALAARAQRMAAQEQEIRRIQAALAKADVTSPEFASSMNSLYSTRSATPSGRSAEARVRATPAHHRGGKTSGPGAATATAGQPVKRTAAGSALTDSPRAVPPQKPHAGESNKRAADTHTRPPPSPRHSSPREALEAWRRSKSQDTSADASHSISFEVVDSTPRPHHGYTPRDSVTSSNIAVPHPGSAEAAHVGPVATVVTVQQEAEDTGVVAGANPLAKPPRVRPGRQAAPFGNTESEVMPTKPSAQHAASPETSLTGSLPTSSIVTDTRSAAPANGSAKPSLYKAAPAASSSPTSHGARAPLPLPPASKAEKTQPSTRATAAVAGLVTPPRSTRPLHPASMASSGETPRSTDSPLARFRKQQGYADPVEHYRAQLSNQHTPLRSQSSLGSTASAPRPVVPYAGGPAAADSKPSNASNHVGEARKRDEAKPVASPKNEEQKRAVGPGTALLLASENDAAAAKSKPSPEKRPPTASPERSAEKRPEKAASPSFKPAAPQKLEKGNADDVRMPTKESSRKRSPPPPVAAADILSWSPADPPALRAHSSRSKSEDASSRREDETDLHYGLVASLKASESPSSSRHNSKSREDAMKAVPRGAARSSAIENATAAAPSSTPAKTTPSKQAPVVAGASPITDGHGNSIWDELSSLERRVYSLEGRTADLERNATKRAVLDAIRLLRERVTLLEDRATILERDEAKEDAVYHLQ